MRGEILDLLLSNAFWETPTQYLAVSPREQVPTSFFPYPSGFVAKPDPSSQRGTHWMAFYQESPSYLEFFDSYAMHPEVYRFPQSPYLKTLDINSTHIQSLHSSDCGQYCIYYLYQCSSGIHYDDIISEVTRNMNHDLFMSIFTYKLRIRHNQS